MPPRENTSRRAPALPARRGHVPPDRRRVVDPALAGGPGAADDDGATGRADRGRGRPTRRASSRSSRARATRRCRRSRAPATRSRRRSTPSGRWLPSPGPTAPRSACAWPSTRARPSCAARTLRRRRRSSAARACAASRMARRCSCRQPRARWWATRCPPGHAARARDGPARRLRPPRAGLSALPSRPAAAVAPLRSVRGAVLAPWPTPLIGRTRERAEVAALLDARSAGHDHGAGGAGKTRLAHAVAEDLGRASPTAWSGSSWPACRRTSRSRARWPARAACARRPACRDDRLLARALAGVRAAGGAGQLRASSSTAARAVVEALLAASDACACSRPAASRSGVPGEVTWRIPPLAFPPEDRARSRSRRSRSTPCASSSSAPRPRTPGFRLDGETRARRCAHLPPPRRHPLALELAAARVRTMPVQRAGGGPRRSLPAADRRRPHRAARGSARCSPPSSGATTCWTSRSARLPPPRRVRRRPSRSTPPRPWRRTTTSTRSTCSGPARAAGRQEPASRRPASATACSRRCGITRSTARGPPASWPAARPPSRLVPQRRARRGGWTASWRRSPCSTRSPPRRPTCSPRSRGRSRPTAARRSSCCIRSRAYWSARHGHAELRATMAAKVLGGLEEGRARWLEALAPVAAELYFAGDLGWMEAARRALDANGEAVDPVVRGEIELGLSFSPPRAPTGGGAGARRRDRARGGQPEARAGTAAGAREHAGRSGARARVRPLIARLERHVPRDAWMHFLLDDAHGRRGAFGGEFAQARRLVEPYLIDPSSDRVPCLLVAAGGAVDGGPRSRPARRRRRRAHDLSRRARSPPRSGGCAPCPLLRRTTSRPPGISWTTRRPG